MGAFLTSRDPQTITQLLAAASLGSATAEERLWSLIYEELHRLAERQMAHEQVGGTLQPTSLVHEAYLRLVGDHDVKWANRRHFFVAAAEAMRRIRIDAARRRRRLKRGGDQRRVPLQDAAAVWDRDPVEVIVIDDALTKLKEIDPRKAEVVSLRYFAGLTVDETAGILDVSSRTVESEWHFARAWLHRELKRGDTTTSVKGNADDR